MCFSHRLRNWTFGAWMQFMAKFSQMQVSLWPILDMQPIALCSPACCSLQDLTSDLLLSVFLTFHHSSYLSSPLLWDLFPSILTFEKAVSIVTRGMSSLPDIVYKSNPTTNYNLILLSYMVRHLLLDEISIVKVCVKWIGLSQNGDLTLRSVKNYG